MRLHFTNFLTFLIVLSVSLVFSVSKAQDASTIDDSVAALTEGVDVLPQRGLPGPIATYGKNSFPVIMGKYEENVYEPVVAASFVEKGRVIAFGHPDYCKSASITSTPSSTNFFKNVLFWVAGKGKKNAKTASGISVAVWRDAQTTQCLKELGFNANTVSNLNDDFDVFVADAVALNDADYEKLFERVKKGAGFVTCGLGWGWSQLNPNKTLTRDHAGNRNFEKYGVSMTWTHGTLDPTAKGGYSVSPKIDFPRFCNGGNALAFLRTLNGSNAEKELATLEAGDRRQLASTVTLLYRYLPQKQRSVCEAVAERYATDFIPTEKNPIISDNLLARLAIAIQIERYLHKQSDGVFEAKDVPAISCDFPGPVSEEAERLANVKVGVKTATPGWASTGLYAAPGETITVSVDPKLIAKSPRPFKVRIGAHSDSLWHLKKWSRYPEITLEKTLTTASLTIANPFGGLVYIVVPDGIRASGLGIVDFNISGAVAAPYFVRDVTSLEDWKKIRNNPAPWAELQGNDVVVTVPSRVIRELDDPQALMDTWDKIIRLEAEFASGPFNRERPERITCDREISAGYMHSGYPVMTHMDVEKTLVDNARLLTRGDWGFFHEFGHNHQSRYWTFEGSGEVTVNYFTLYIMDKMCGLTPEQTRADLTKEKRMAMLKKYWANGTNFEEWKDNPFLALNMTVQMLNDFGWEPFLRTVSEYAKAPQSELPKNDDEKRDQWMVRLSRNAGVNLGPFFEKWGVPTSQEARDSIKDLPIWLPVEFNEQLN